MAQLKVFDTNAMIAVSKGLLSVAPHQTRVVVSIITRLELLCWPELSVNERTLVREMVDSIEVAAITQEVEDRVIEVRSSRNLKLPDAIIAATAMSLGAPLVTNDARFSGVPGLAVETF